MEQGAAAQKARDREPWAPEAVRKAAREVAGSVTGKGRAAPEESETKILFRPFSLAFFLVVSSSICSMEFLLGLENG